MSALHYLDANGLQVTACRVTWPAYGAWVADVVCASDDPLPPGPVVLTLGTLSLVGAVVRQDAFAGVRSLRLVAGFGGWRAPVLARAYQSPGGVPAASVLVDAALEVGETIAVPPPPAVTLGTAFVREAASASRVLRQVVGPAWWIDTAGLTHVEPRPPGAPIATPYLVEAYDPGRGWLLVSTEDLADWQPGAIVVGPTVLAPVTLASVSIAANDDGVLRVEGLAA